MTILRTRKRPLRSARDHPPTPLFLVGVAYSDAIADEHCAAGLFLLALVLFGVAFFDGSEAIRLATLCAAPSSTFYLRRRSRGKEQVLFFFALFSWVSLPRA